MLSYSVLSSEYTTTERLLLKPFASKGENHANWAHISFFFRLRDRLDERDLDTLHVIDFMQSERVPLPPPDPRAFVHLFCSRSR